MNRKGRSKRTVPIQERPVVAKTKQGERVDMKAKIAEDKLLMEEVYGYIKDGMKSNEIYAMLVVRDDKMNEGRFLHILRSAYDFAETALYKDRDYTFQLHMDRYEAMYEKSINMVDIWNRKLDPKNGAHWQTIVVKYIQAIEALQHKEKLLGLHDKKVVLEFNDNSATIVTKPETRGAEGIAGYSFDKLTLDEKIELLSLIKDCRTVPLEGVQRVTIKKTVVEINPDTLERNVAEKVQTIDTTYEELPANVVKRMTNIKEKDIEEKPLEIPDVIDSRGPVPKPKTAKELGDAIQNTIMDDLKKKLKERRGI